MKGKILLLAGAAVGYVLGTRAGRERYEQIKANVTRAWNDPRVQEKVTEAEHFVSDTAKQKMPQVQEKISETTRSAVGAARNRFGSGGQDDDALTPDGEATRQPSSPTQPSGPTPPPGGPTYPPTSM